MSRLLAVVSAFGCLEGWVYLGRGGGAAAGASVARARRFLALVLWFAEQGINKGQNSERIAS